MKQNFIFYVLVILNIGNIAFSGEVNVPQGVTDFRAAYQQLQAAQTSGVEDKILAAYGKMADINLPPTGWFPMITGDPYATERTQQKEAIAALEAKAATEADPLPIYLLAPVYFAAKIKAIKDIPTELKTLQDAYDKAQSLNQEASKLEEEGNEAEAKAKKDEALVEYGKVADIVIPPAPTTGLWAKIINPYSVYNAEQKTAVNAIEASVASGTDEEKLAAYKKYAPKHFAQEIINLEEAITGKESDETLRVQEDVFNKANEAAGKGNYTRAKQIIQNFIDTNPSATLKTKAQALLADIEKQEAAPAKLLITSLQKLTTGLTQVKQKISKPA